MSISPHRRALLPPVQTNSSSIALPTDGMRTAHLLIESGIYWVLLEAVVRRALPDSNTMILAVKFAYFPLLYVALWRRFYRCIQFRYWPPGIFIYLLWGATITIAQDYSRPIPGGLGIMIHILFAPAAFLGAAYYSDRQSVDLVLWRFTLVSGVIGALGICQNFLPPDHWLNLTMENETNTFDMGGEIFRVSSSFQFCNVFSSFTILGGLICYGTFRRTHISRRKQIAATCLALIYVGGINSGSRVASVGVLAVISFCLLSDRAGRRIAVYVLTLLAFFVIALSISAPERVAKLLEIGEIRTFAVDDLIERVTDLYFGETQQNALKIGGGLGIGWGHFTFGLQKFTSQGDADGQLPYVEGGYAVVMAQTGLAGLILIGYTSAVFLLYSLKDRSEWRWLGVGLAAWSILGNLPFAMQQVSVLAIPWWFLVGIYFRQSEQHRVDVPSQPRFMT